MNRNDPIYKMEATLPFQVKCSKAFPGQCLPWNLPVVY